MLCQEFLGRYVMKLSKFDVALLVTPALMFGVGFLMNAVVMAANGGQMPVLIPGGDCASFINPEDFVHGCMTHATHLKILADWVVINHFGIASPGDFFEWAADGAFWPCLIAFIARLTKGE